MNFFAPIVGVVGFNDAQMMNASMAKSLQVKPYTMEEDIADGIVEDKTNSTYWGRVWSGLGFGGGQQ